jgi:nicotinamidase-related amidase
LDHGRKRCLASESDDHTQEKAMDRDLGVWTDEDCALVLIDYQPELFESIRSETDANLVELHVRLLAKAANAFDMPIVLSTIGVEANINSPTQPALAAELPDIEPIDRTSMNAFEDQAFRDAVKATGRKRLIMGGLVTEVCLAFAVVEALKAGYEAQFVTDAVGGRSQIAHRTAIERLTAAGAVPNTAIALVCELFRDWATPLGEPARELVNWYVSEVSKLTDEVGFAEREQLRAQAAVAG